MSIDKLIIGSLVRAALEEEAKAINHEEAEAALRQGAAKLDGPRPGFEAGDLVTHDGAIFKPFPFGFGLFRRWLDEPRFPTPTNPEDFGSAHALEPHDCVVAQVQPGGAVIEYLMPSRRLRPYVRPEQPPAAAEAAQPANTAAA